MRRLKKGLWTLWQLPQMILGQSVLWVCLWRGQKVERIEDYWVVDYLFDSGVSLGDFIILQRDHYDALTIAHERGHRRQSYRLGPLYLIVIGLPSGMLNIFSRFSPYIAKRYYQFFTEAWADRLAGIERE